MLKYNWISPFFTPTLRGDGIFITWGNGTSEAQNSGYQTLRAEGRFGTKIRMKAPTSFFHPTPKTPAARLIPPNRGLKDTLQKKQNGQREKTSRC